MDDERRVGGPPTETDASAEPGSAGRFGAPDVDALRRVRRRFETHEPLVDRTAFDSTTNPTTLSVTLTDGIESSGRFDVRWSDRGFYGFHYHEPTAGLACRFDRHTKPGTPEKHFHPPPDAPSSGAEPSCIAVELPDLVTLAVIHAWRFAYDGGTLESINDLANPP